MKRITVALLLTLGLIFSYVDLASAITNGELDGDGHPDVVLLLIEVNGQPAYRCSGTLISPTVVLTSGHCTGSPDYSGMRIFTESDVESGIGITNNYPFAGPNSVEAVAWYAHPLFETAPYFVHDVGVVLLAEPVFLDQYGVLPFPNQLDALGTRRGLQNVTFTAVGYGLQESLPTPASFLEHNERVRMVAYPTLIAINVPGFTGDYSLLLSNNHATGGTCYGDSGGPNFLGDSNIIAGVSSYSMNGNCAGTGGVFRMDKQDVLDFVNSFLN